MPSYFNEDINNEYKELLRHADNMLPKTDKQLAYLPSFFPFSLLDIRPTKLVNNDDLQAFANFNFGVLGSRFLNFNQKQLSNLPSISICKKSKCKQQRIELIKQFLAGSKSEIQMLRQNKNLYIVQQTELHVFRINNTFYSPAGLITYYPSKQAGFVPSGDFKLSKLDEAPNMLTLSEATYALREQMAKYNVAAITKVNKESLNIIFGGIADNHWGIVINHNSTIPTSGDYSHIGLKYDVVQKVSDNSFYYQTN
ncbi:hypothetical protein KO525_17285 [Psychrosphaera sp. B3R10]|nr:hypothetical protein [Psychrosphaera sp. I2R16]MBU2991134.1 hypothetical protein [Psychrosphaera sp. B3R10]